MTFDGPNRRIILSPGTTETTAIAIYSAWKDWVLTGQGANYPAAFRVIGGDDLGGGVAAGSYFFLQTPDGWRIRPQEAHHTLKISGNLFPENPADEFLTPTLGTFRVLTNLQTSSLTQVSSAGGGGGGLTGPQAAQLTAIKAKTDNLPIDPASETTAAEARDYAAANGG